MRLPAAQQDKCDMEKIFIFKYKVKKLEGKISFLLFVTSLKFIDMYLIIT